MAKIMKCTKSTRGKEIRCSKCGIQIKAGGLYLKATPFKRSPIIRCTTCGLKPYETSGSEYIREVGALVEDWNERFDSDMSGVGEIISELETLKEQCESSLENIPEQLQESETGELLQSRIDALEEAISELEAISEDECRDDAGTEVDNALGDEYDPGDERCASYESEAEWNAAREEQLDLEMERIFDEKISEALSRLEY